MQDLIRQESAEVLLINAEKQMWTLQPTSHSLQEQVSKALHVFLTTRYVAHLVSSSVGTEALCPVIHGRLRISGIVNLS